MEIFTKFATEKYRWIALVFLTLGLAIVIIDNTVLNVAIPYILRDIHTSFASIQWVISGYALIIATLLITIGRLGDVVGRKKIFIFGAILFAIGSFFASIARDIVLLFYGEAFIEAIGASMMLTSSLSLLVSEFKGRERSVAFGIWGSVAGASATIGPLLGGYLTTYHSWRWSLRINVFVAIIAIIGSIFIQESRGEGEKKFDWIGTIFSGLGLFSLVFAIIEGNYYGWWKSNMGVTFLWWHWPFTSISLIPFAFAGAFFFLIFFGFNEKNLEKKGKSPLLKLSMFTYRSFSLGLITLGIVSLGQFGVFFVMPIFLQNALNLTAFHTGIFLLSTSLTIAIVGPLSGFIASKIGPKWLTSVGMFFLAIGTYLLHNSLKTTATWLSLAPGLMLFGIGIGMASAQLTNIVLSSVPQYFAGEASAINNTVRQLGTSIGIAIIGAVLTLSIHTNIINKITIDKNIPQGTKQTILTNIQNINIESGQSIPIHISNGRLARLTSEDIKNALATASQDALMIALIFIGSGAVFSLLIPNIQSSKASQPSQLQQPTRGTNIDKQDTEEYTLPIRNQTTTSIKGLGRRI